MDNERFQRLFETAFNNMRECSYKEALDILDTLLEADPDNENVLFQKIQCLKLSRSDKQTIAECDNYLRKFGENEQIYIWKGIAYSELENYKRAINNYDLALKLNPNNSTAYTAKGIAYLTLKEYEKALQLFNIAIELTPNYTNAYNNRSKTKEFLNYPPENSLKDLQTAMELEPNNLIAVSNFIETHIKLKNYEKALELTNNSEQNAILQVLRGLAYYFLGTEENAINCIAPYLESLKAELENLNKDMIEIKRLISSKTENNYLIQNEEAIERLITAGNYIVEKINEQTIGICPFCNSPIIKTIPHIKKGDLFICNNCLNICNEIMQEKKSSLNYPSKYLNKELKQETNIICNFCGRTKIETEYVIAAADSFYICNGCVGVCNNVLKNNSDFDTEYKKAIENVPLDMVAKTPDNIVPPPAQASNIFQENTFLKFLNNTFTVLKTIILILLITTILYAKFHRINNHSQHYNTPQQMNVTHTSEHQ